jgi:hypothetical protein
VSSRFEIRFSELWTYECGNSSERVPLAQLSDRGGHVHGRLEIQVNGLSLPYLGYFGPDDVCFNEWLFQLHAALNTLRSAPRISHTYDEGEQGQPAFLFEREDDALFVSIVASELSDGAAHPDWQRVPCSFADFDGTVARFLADFRQHLCTAAPQFAAEWWSRIVE